MSEISYVHREDRTKLRKKFEEYEKKFMDYVALSYHQKPATK